MPKTLMDRAKEVLVKNDRGAWTVPSSNLYPHQWLWDSCFIAIGLAEYNPQRAAIEIRSLLDGQWLNGMVPHMIFWHEPIYDSGPAFWRSDRSPFAPRRLRTSGITQPPMVAEACWRIARKLPKDRSDSFLRQVFPKIVSYHQWLYRDRDIDGNGLVALYHPWETGIDNAPKWMAELEGVHTPRWIRLIEALKLEWLVELALRRDLKFVRLEQRISTGDSLRLTHIALGLRKRRYDNQRILAKPHFVTESLSFNCILAANNRRLRQIAEQMGEALPPALTVSMDLTDRGISGLWDESSKRFEHRNLVTDRLETIEGIAQLLPLYSGAVDKSVAAKLVKRMTDSRQFWPNWPVPSVPLDAPGFDPERYWQGPTWVNTNWLLIQGLREYGYSNEAEQLRQKTLALVEKSGFFEYYSPIDGRGEGIDDFSWSAALTISLLAEDVDGPGRHQRYGDKRD